MAKFYGPIGYGVTAEKAPGVWVEEIEERCYSGDLRRNSKNTVSSDRVIDNVNVSNEISIIADLYACQNFHSMKYVGFMGAKWKITNVTVQHPRLILTVGGVYNGAQT